MAAMTSAALVSAGMSAAAAGATAAVGYGLVGAALISKLSKKPGAQNLPDPATERAKAETEAAQRTNSKLAMRNKARAASSLLAKPIDSTSSDVSALGGGGGKTTLGQ